MGFNSILGEEMMQYLILRKESCSKSTYDHNKQVLKSFDCFLQSSGCTSKEIEYSGVCVRGVRSERNRRIID